MQNQKFDRMMSYYAKMLIVISITLIIYGIVLQYTSKEKPTLSTETKEEESLVSVTSVDGGLEDNPTYKVEGTSEKNKVETNISIEEMNNKLRNELQEKYDISIYYGKETDNYKIKNFGYNIKTHSITNSSIINEQLTKLKKVLSHYPEDLFEEIKKGGIPLSIYLIESYDDRTITGITDSTYSYANISLAAIFPLEESFYHESYHYIERYLYKKGANFNSWNSLNPTDFEYGKVYNNLSYSQTFQETASFVNNYAQTDSQEDRASTFEYMMAPTKASCLNKNNTVWNKARYMSLTIERVLKSVNPNTIEYWERYL